MEQEIDHFRYPKADIKEADGVAWVFTNKDSEMVKYPFKFFDLEADEVRLKILHTSICQSDILTVRELWGPCEYPACPGHEIVGQITHVGADVKDRKVGDIVGVTPIRKCCHKCHYCVEGKTNLCDERVFLYSEAYFGGYATHAQIDASWTIPIPHGMPLDIVAPILCAGLTVYSPLKRHYKPNWKCAVIGIGGLGHLGVQYANKLGMHVTAFTTKPDRKKELFELGASDIQHSVDIEELKKNQGKFDIVLNCIFVENEEVYKYHQRLTAPGGVYIGVGVPNSNTSFTLDHEYFMQKQIKIAGSIVASIEDAIDTVNFSAQYNVYPLVEKFGFEEFPKAFHRSEKETPKFRCTINVTDWAKQNGFDK